MFEYGVRVCARGGGGGGGGREGGGPRNDSVMLPCYAFGIMQQIANHSATNNRDHTWSFPLSAIII
eukprot:SAG11_NODE_1102_length_5866_cov_2.173574_4_plen_66_part_00